MIFIDKNQRLFVSDCRIVSHNGRKLVVFPQDVKFLDYPAFNTADLHGDKEEGGYKDLSFLLVSISTNHSPVSMTVSAEVGIVEPIVFENNIPERGEIS